MSCSAALICVNLATKGLICWLSIGKECYILSLYVILSAGLNRYKEQVSSNKCGLFQHLKVKILHVSSDEAISLGQVYINLCYWSR